MLPVRNTDCDYSPGGSRVKMKKSAADILVSACLGGGTGETIGSFAQSESEDIVGRTKAHRESWLCWEPTAPVSPPSMLLDGNRPASLERVGQITCTFRSTPLLPQNYTVKMIIRAANLEDLIVDYQEVASFSVVGNLADCGYKGRLSDVCGPFDSRRCAL
jgi:hypothetical protein